MARVTVPPLHVPRKTTSEASKVVRACGAFNIFTWTCASRHNGKIFFDISTAKGGPGPSDFDTFDLEMCFALQRRALFRHLNFQNWSETISFLHLTWKCASRHNGVHFFDSSTSNSGPNMVCFVHVDFEICFVPQRRAIVHLSSGQLAPHPPL